MSKYWPFNDLIDGPMVRFDFRYAVTVWYMDREERLEYAERVRMDKENLGARV